MNFSINSKVKSSFPAPIRAPAVFRPGHLWIRNPAEPGSWGIMAGSCDCRVSQNLCL